MNNSLETQIPKSSMFKKILFTVLTLALLAVQVVIVNAFYIETFLCDIKTIGPNAFYDYIYVCPIPQSLIILIVIGLFFLLDWPLFKMIWRGKESVKKWWIWPLVILTIILLAFAIIAITAMMHVSL